MSVHIDDRTLSDVREIQRLLAEAYRHYFENSDGYCKSSEGAVSISIPPFFWDDEELDRNGYKRRPGVTVYSYVLGPSRQHYFDDSTEALEAVRVWHQEEMECDHGSIWDD